MTWIEAGEICQNSDIYLVKTGIEHLKSKNWIHARLLLQNTDSTVK